MTKEIRSAWRESRAFRIAVRVVIVGLSLAALLGNPMALAILVPLCIPRRRLLAAVSAA